MSDLRYAFQRTNLTCFLGCTPYSFQHLYVFSQRVKGLLANGFLSRSLGDKELAMLVVLLLELLHMVMFIRALLGLMQSSILMLRSPVCTNIN